MPPVLILAQCVEQDHLPDVILLSTLESMTKATPLILNVISAHTEQGTGGIWISTCFLISEIPTAEA